MKGANRCIKIWLVLFLKKKKFIWGNLIVLGHFLLFDWAWSKLRKASATIGFLNSLDMISFMITTGSWNNQDMIRILKQSRHYFSGKHLCDGYCMNIIWCLCVEVKIEQRVIWLCKASLRNCCISLFACKGPWVLKTDNLIFYGNIKYFTAFCGSVWRKYGK